VQLFISKLQLFNDNLNKFQTLAGAALIRFTKTEIMILKTIPILRIFDIAKAKEFYIDWLGFEITFEHPPIAIGVEPNTPYYIGVKKDDIKFHLSEHHGDSVPGIRVFIICTGIEKYLAELQSRPYKYYRPSVQETFYGAKEMTVQDPFGNKLSFNEYISKE
jgi:hypothetical protein